MSADIVLFPGRKARQPDSLDSLAARIGQTIASLPPINEPSAEQLRLLRRIDRKLGDLVKMMRQGGAQ